LSGPSFGEVAIRVAQTRRREDPVSEVWGHSRQLKKSGFNVKLKGDAKGDAVEDEEG